MRKIVVSEGVTVDGIFDAETIGKWVTPFQSDERNACVDEYDIMVHPVVMGSGKRFFKEGTGLTKLKLLESRTLPLGVIFLRYATAR